MSEPVEADLEVVIEHARPEDADAVATLFFEDMQDLGVDTSLEELREVAREVTEASAGPASPGPASDVLCWVARLSPGTPAVGVLLANFNWSLKFGGRSLWIDELYVTPAARRRSLGRRLVEALLEYAEQHGIRGIDIEAYQGNTPASILYRSLGFHRLGRERFYYRLGPKEYL